MRGSPQLRGNPQSRGNPPLQDPMCLVADPKGGCRKIVRRGRFKRRADEVLKTRRRAFDGAEADRTRTREGP